MPTTTIGNQVVVDPSLDQSNDPLRDRNNNHEGDPQQPSIIANNPQMPSGLRQRQLMRWDVPGFPSYVDMYINPQQMSIQERKIISKRRTKGGYVIQYWGEELPTINIGGSTAAAGIEGINILRDVYRAEQKAFEKVAQTLNDRLGSFSLSGLAGSVRDAATNPGKAIGSAIAGLFSSGVNPPLLPTLGSLALSVSLYYQGAVYKGYFMDFYMEENVAQGMGVFNYRMTFQVTNMRGTRRNFAPWHRSPADIDPVTGQPANLRHSDYETTPLSFNGEG